MAIAYISSIGQANNTSSTSTTVVTTTGATAVTDLVLVMPVGNNGTTADGDNSEITGVVDSVGNSYVKAGEHTNTVGGAAADGAMASIWYSRHTTILPIGGTITITYGTARADRCTQVQKFSTGDVVVPVAVVTNGTDGSAGFGSATIAGLTSKSRLYIRLLAKEANATTSITVSSGFTTLNSFRSQNAATAMLWRGEYRINTSTGETSNPTLATVGDTAAVFVAFEEVTSPVTKYPSAQEQHGSKVQFTSPSNALTYNGTSATFSFSPPTSIEAAIRVYNFGLDSIIPSGATITGVTANLRYSSSAGTSGSSGVTYTITPYVGGVAQTTSSSASPRGSDTHGSLTTDAINITSNYAWTRSSLTDASFKLGVEFDYAGASATVSLDSISITVTWTVVAEITHVKTSAYGSNEPGLTATSAFASGNAVGNQIVAVVGTYNATEVLPVVTDSGGNTYTRHLSTTIEGNKQLHFFATQNASASTLTLTATVGTSIPLWIRAAEFNGASNNLETTASQSGTSVSTAFSLGFTTTTASPLIVSARYHNNAVANTWTSPATELTDDAVVVGDRGSVGWREGSSTPGSHTLQGTGPNGEAYTMGAIVLKNDSVSVGGSNPKHTFFFSHF